MCLVISVTKDKLSSAASSIPNIWNAKQDLVFTNQEWNVLFNILKRSYCAGFLTPLVLFNWKICNRKLPLGWQLSSSVWAIWPRRSESAEQKRSVCVKRSLEIVKQKNSCAKYLIVHEHTRQENSQGEDLRAVLTLHNTHERAQINFSEYLCQSLTFYHT